MPAKNVFITGTSSGIGLSAAKRLDAAGWRVFAGVLPGEDMTALKTGASDRLTVLPIDITKPQMVSQAAETLSKAVGEAGLHGLVNNAGIAVIGPLEFIPVEALRQQLEVNLIGHVSVTQAMLPLIRQARGRIVNTTSILGRVTTPFSGAYCMSKYAMEAFTDTLRMELAPWEIDVIAIEPGFIATPIWGKAANSTGEIADELPPQGRTLYGKSLAALRASMAAAHTQGSSPEVVADAIFDALNATRPKTRYLPGSQARLIATVRWLLPDRIVDRIILRRYDP